MRGSRTRSNGSRPWALFMIGMNLAGAAWLTVHMAVFEREGLVAVLIAAFAVSVLVVNLRGARKTDGVGARRMVRHGHLLLPEDFGAPEVRSYERIAPPQPRLGAPGSLN